MSNNNTHANHNAILRVIATFHDLQTDTSSDRTVTKVCPRCGRNAMDENPLHNALSRHATVYVCNACGMDEAVRDFTHTPLPLEKWACAVLAQAKVFHTTPDVGTCNIADKWV